MFKNSSPPLTVNYRFTEISDQHPSYKAEGITNKNPSYFWRTTMPSAEASLEICFNPCLLYSIEVKNQGSPTIEVVVYNKDSDGNQIHRFVCIPKATFITYNELKLADYQTGMKLVKLRDMTNFPKDRLYSFMRVTVSNPFHGDDDRRTLGLQSLIITRLDEKPVQEFDRIKESIQKRNQAATEKLEALQGKTTPLNEIPNNTPQKGSLSVFKNRDTPSHMISGGKSSNFLNIPQKTLPNNPASRSQQNSINSAYVSIKGDGLFTDDSKQNLNYKIENRSPNKQPNRFGLASNKGSLKKTVPEDSQTEQEYEAQLMKALEESKKIYDKEQHLREMGMGNLYISLDSQKKSDGEQAATEDRENISYYYQNLIYGAERMDEEIERSTAIPWEDIESSQDMPLKGNSVNNEKIVEEEVKDLDEYKYIKNTPKKTPQKNSANTPLSNKTWQQHSPPNYGRDMWVLQEKDYSSEFLELERKERAKMARNQIIGANEFFLRDVVFSLSGFEGEDRNKLRKKMINMGAKFMDDIVAGVTTHVICNFPNTRKYNLAKETPGVSIVNQEFVYECEKQKQLVNERNFELQY